MNFVRKHLVITHIILATIVFFLGFVVGKMGDESLLGNPSINGNQIDNPPSVPTESSFKEETVSADTMLVFMRKYTLSGEIGIVEEKVSSGYIGLNEKELKEKFTGWELRSFDKEKAVFYKEIESYSDSTYMITTAKDENGTEVVCVYKYDIDGNRHLFETCASPVELFDEATKEKLREGISVNTEEELRKLLEEYDD